MRIIRQLDNAIEIVPTGVGDGYTLYLISNGIRKYIDHTWTYSIAVERAYQILDSQL